MATDTPHLWRASAKLLAYVEGGALVWIPAMEAGHDRPVVPFDVLPPGRMVGDRFHLRTTLDHDDFCVAPCLDGRPS